MDVCAGESDTRSECAACEIRKTGVSRSEEEDVKVPCTVVMGTREWLSKCLSEYGRRFKSSMC